MSLHWISKSYIHNVSDVTAPVDASKAFAFQFGSISPGFMNGMQVFGTVSCS
jgi:translation initiation factor 4G